MKKKDVQKRVLQNGKPLALSKFNWDSKTNTFSSNESYLVIDFEGISNCNFNTRDGCTFKTLYNCTFNTGHSCTFSTGFNCTFSTGDNCTFKTLYNCTFNTGHSCTFSTGSNCTFSTGDNCTFSTWSNCTFRTGFNCTFKTWNSCTFSTKGKSVLLRRDVYEIIELKENEILKLLPYKQKGYVVKKDTEDYFHYPNSIDRIEIIDGIVSKVIQEKGKVLKVINEGEEKESYIVTDGESYAHGKTIKEAKESLIYKITDRDTSMYDDYTLDSEISIEEGIKMYRKITGSCESETKSFVDNIKEKKNEYTIKEIIDITKGQYGNNSLVEFFKK